MLDISFAFFLATLFCIPYSIIFNSTHFWPLKPLHHHCISSTHTFFIRSAIFSRLTPFSSRIHVNGIYSHVYHIAISLFGIGQVMERQRILLSQRFDFCETRWCGRISNDTAYFCGAAGDNYTACGCGSSHSDLCPVHLTSMSELYKPRRH